MIRMSYHSPYYVVSNVVIVSIERTLLINESIFIPINESIVFCILSSLKGDIASKSYTQEKCNLPKSLIPILVLFIRKIDQYTNICPVSKHASCKFSNIIVKNKFMCRNEGIECIIIYSCIFGASYRIFFSSYSLMVKIDMLNWVDWELKHH